MSVGLALVLGAVSGAVSAGVPATAPTVVNVSRVSSPRPAVVVSAKLADVRVGVAWGGGRAGGVSSLAAMARATGAQAVINGGYFDAYSRDGVADPYHTLVVNGWPQSLGSVGSVLAIAPDGTAQVERGNPKITGTVGGRSFYLYRVNHTPGASVAALYTRAWGARTGLAGSYVRIDANRRVIDKGEGDVAIPDGGGVLLFRGSDGSQADRFRPGDQVQWSLKMPNMRRPDVWTENSVWIGCGPMLVRGGQVDCNPTAEGFTSSRVAGSQTRSAMGVTGDGRVVFVASAGMFAQLAQTMKALGCTEAIGLDGGASSGLWANGSSLRGEGRQVSHGITLVPR
ncbi:MAG TPA: phosphodiester glycosidase family protein [Fimbriimonadaceae bacterium]|nr:phosphodiester glycosidase family protein [Fimbriimonadaceae bacterium]HRE94952.1 phosphodiester glycosidase family protein [Fimbriimonadaceae bacterium]